MRSYIWVAVAIFLCIVAMCTFYVATTGAFMSGPKDTIVDKNNTGSGITGLSMTLQTDKILVGGDTVEASVQLMRDDQPLKVNNINVDFVTGNATVVIPYGVSSVKTDNNGIAKATFITNETIGIADIIATVTDGGVDLNTSATLNVVGWGTISGFITDKNRNGIPNANVQLWKYGMGPNGEYVNIALVKHPSNPQMTNDGSTAAMGTYTFERIPWGIYNVTAEKDGHSFFAIVNITRGTATHNVALPDYVYYFGPTAEPPAKASAAPLPDLPKPKEGCGVIIGFVTDKNRNGIPGANVTLYDYKYDNSTSDWRNTGITKIEGNPALSSDGKETSVGTYMFMNVPFGTYNATGEKDGHLYYAIVNLTKGTATHNIGIPDYVIPSQ